jgi:hypothetical protein
VRIKGDGEGEGDARWEDGYNRTLAVPAGATAISVLLEWGGDMKTEVTSGGQVTAAAPAASRQGSGADSGSDSEGSGGEGEARGSRSDGGSSFDDSMALLPQWQGRELRFMQRNEHTRWVMPACLGAPLLRRGASLRGVNMAHT